MTAAALPLPPVVHRWACEALRIDPDAPEEVRRAALFDRIRAADFRPTGAESEAADLLSRGPPITETRQPTAFDAAREETLLRESGQLARQWFHLSSLERQRRWLSLRTASVAYPAVWWRLDELKPGLPLRGEVIAPAEVASLIEKIRELFIARPACRAELRRLFRRQLATQDAKARRSAVLSVQRQHGEWARLDERFLRQAALRPHRPMMPRYRFPKWLSRLGWLIPLALGVLMGILGHPRDVPRPPAYQPPWSMPRVQPSSLIPHEIRGMLSREATLTHGERAEVALFFEHALRANHDKRADAVVATLILAGLSDEQRHAVRRILKRVVDDRKSLISTGRAESEAATAELPTDAVDPPAAGTGASPDIESRVPSRAPSARNDVEAADGERSR